MADDFTREFPTTPPGSGPDPDRRGRTSSGPDPDRRGRTYDDGGVRYRGGSFDPAGDESTRSFDFGPDDFQQSRRPRGRRPQRLAPKRERRPAWFRIGRALAIVVVVVLAATGIVRAAYGGKALPGTTIGGESVGGQDRAAITDTVERLASGDRRIRMSTPRGTLQVTAGGAGLDADVAATVDRALSARRGSFFSPLISLVHGKNVPLEAEVDSTKLKASVKRIAQAVDKKPYAGALNIDPQTLKVRTSTSKAGRAVDQPKLTKLLRKALLHPTDKTIAAPVETTQAVSDAGVQKVATQARAYLKSSVKFTGAGKTYTASPSTIAPLLALESVNDGRAARLGVDTAVLSKLTARVANARNRTAKSAKITAPARGPILDGKDEVILSPKAAKVTVTSEGHSGLAVQVPALNQKVRAAIKSGSHSIAVPTKTTAAPVSKTSAKKIDHVIGTFSTAYIAGQPRVTNIQHIAAAIDGTIIAPGQQFSLNGIAGERTKAKGYVEAPFIAGNKIQPSVGGGVSQFSTTMYNAAYFAGLQIDAHQPHSLYITRYPAGRESTLNWPDIDMKWTNDTSTPILIRTYADDAGVTVTLYGDNGGRKVTATPGDHTPNTAPGGNFDITVTRTIRYPDGRVVKQPTTTKYYDEVTDGGPPQE
ncbi:MAG: VanW family protein [Solirubrobacteraceae bacterium]